MGVAQIVKANVWDAHKIRALLGPSHSNLLLPCVAKTDRLVKSMIWRLNQSA